MIEGWGLLLISTAGIMESLLTNHITPPPKGIGIQKFLKQRQICWLISVPKKLLETLHKAETDI